VGLTLLKKVNTTWWDSVLLPYFHDLTRCGRNREAVSYGVLRQPYVSEYLLLIAVWTGLEPATLAVTGRYSSQLNYQTNLSERPGSNRRP
jgi:hypothetical protein